MQSLHIPLVSSPSSSDGGQTLDKYLVPDSDEQPEDSKSSRSSADKSSHQNKRGGTPEPSSEGQGQGWELMD